VRCDAWPEPVERARFCNQTLSLPERVPRKRLCVTAFLPILLGSGAFLFGDVHGFFMACMLPVGRQAFYVNVCEVMMSSVLDAAYLTAQDYPGGAKALAVRMEQKPAVLSHKLNPNDTANHLTVTDLMTIMVMTGNHRALHAACLEFGYMALPLPAQTDDMTTDALTDTCKEFADYLQSVTGALADNKVTANELKKVRKELGEMVAAAGKLEAILAAKETKRGRA
jgi:hypothetical protein